MNVREAYRMRTVRVCVEHYDGRRPLPSDAPPLGPVEDARARGCQFCEREAADRRSALFVLAQLERAETDNANAVDHRGCLRDERLALHAALASDDAERIRHTTASARRVMHMWAEWEGRDLPDDCSE